MSRNGHHGYHLRLADVSDFDLLEAIIDGERNEWTLSVDIGKRFGVPEEFAARVCSARFAWMKRFGWLEYKPGNEFDDNLGGRWRVTRVARNLITGDMPAGLDEMLAHLDDGQRAQVLQVVAQQVGRRRKGTPAHTLYRRTFVREAKL